MKKIKVTAVLMIILTVLTLTACTRKSEDSSPESRDKFNLIYPGIIDINAKLVDIMGQADIIPYYEKMIKEKKEMGILTGTKEKGKEGAETGAKDSEPEFKPKPITNDDNLLLKTIEEEASYTYEELKEQIPEDIIYTWQNIAEKIDNLHVQWDDLKPELVQAKIPAKTIAGFDKTLNDLSISASDHNYIRTIINANALGEYIAQFFKELNDHLSASIYFIKYQVRQIILDVAENNSQNIDISIDSIRSHQEKITLKLIERDSKNLADKIKSSTLSLKEAISLQDLNIIKIKAGIVIKNINSARDKLSIK